MFTIFYEWKSSLGLFKKDTLLLLLYSWYKLTVQVYKALVRYFWWLIVPLIVFLIYSHVYGDYARVSTILGAIVFLVIQYIVILLARPSLEKKDFKYVFDKGLTYKFSVLITFFLYKLSLVISIGLILLSCVPFVAFNGQLFVAWFLSLLTFFKGIDLFLWWWILLFLLDSKGSIRDCFVSVWHGYKMMLFNLPIVMILVSIFYIHALIHSYLPNAFQMPFFHVLLYPAAITLIATLYIKRVHDQCSLFFGRDCA